MSSSVPRRFLKRALEFAEGSGAYWLVLRLAIQCYGIVSRLKAPFSKEGLACLRILDFQYKNTRGHHHALNRLLLDTAAQQKLSVDVLASRYLEDGLRSANVRPVFRAQVYEPVSVIQDLLRKATRIQSATSADLLALGFAWLLIPRQVILVHTATPWHLRALFEIMAACRSPCLVNVFLMLPPTFDVSPELANEQANAYRTSWKFMSRARLRVRFWTENKLLAAAYQELGFAGIQIMAMPARLPPCRPKMYRPGPRQGEQHFSSSATPEMKKVSVWSSKPWPCPPSAILHSHFVCA